MSDTPIVLTRPPEISFRKTAVDFPAAIYIGRDDVLFVQIQNAVPNAGVRVLLRRLSVTGEVIPDSFDFFPPGDRSSNVFSRQLQESFLLGVTAINLGAPVTRAGQMFLTVALLRDVITTGVRPQALISDYVYGGYQPVWPPGNWIHSIDGHGILRFIIGTQPAAGGNILETVPTGARWRLHSWNHTLTTSAAVATRISDILITDALNNNQAVYPPSASQLASLARTYTMQIGSTVVTTDPGQIAIPTSDEIWLLQGWRIQTGTVAIQAGDQYNAPQYVVEEWIEL